MTARTIRRALLLLPLLALPAAAQDAASKKKKKPVDWAPAWKVGDWWTVKVYQKDLRRRLSSPSPVKGGGGEPRLPEAEGPRLPGFPPLRHGVPKGYKLGNVWRFEVLRKETVKYDDGPPIDTPPETFWVVEAKTTQGTPVRRVELYYATEDLVLSKLVIKAPPKSRQKDRVRWTKGTAQLAPPESASLGLPLAWPDFKAAHEARTRFPRPKHQTVEQRVRREKPGTQDERDWVLIQQVTAKRGQPRLRCVFEFAPKQPFWTRMEAGLFLAELAEHGHAGD